MRSGWRVVLLGLGLAGIVGFARAEDKKPASDPHKKEAPPAAKKDAPPAGDKKPAEAKKDGAAEADPMMAMMKELGTPGPEHKVLERMAGEWDHVVRWHMAGDAPWEESKGTTTRRVMFGGRYIHAETKSPPMEEGGQPFEGRGVTGYDKARKQYFNAWIDNEGTGIMLAYGSVDATGNVLTFHSDEPDWSNPGKLKKMKSIYRFKDDKTHVFEMYETGMDGKEFVMLEVTYTKK